jgi:hypothetical protein
VDIAGDIPARRPVCPAVGTANITPALEQTAAYGDPPALRGGVSLSPPTVPIGKPAGCTGQGGHRTAHQPGGLRDLREAQLERDPTGPHDSRKRVLTQTARRQTATKRNGRRAAVARRPLLPWSLFTKGACPCSRQERARGPPLGRRPVAGSLGRSARGWRG